MSYVQNLETNCKGRFAADFEPLTLLVGPNASHKSGAITAIELALTGRCDLGALPSNLLELAPAGESLHVVLGLSDGQALTFEIAGSTAKAFKPVWNGQGIGTVLSREVGEILRSDVKHLRAALLRAAVGDLDIGALAAAYIPVAFQPIWHELTGGTAIFKYIDSVDDLVELPKAIRARIRDLTVTEVTDPVDAVDADTLHQLRGELAAVELRLRAVRLRAERDRLIGSSAPVRADVNANVDAQKLLRLEQLIEAAQTVANWIARTNDFGCPACGADMGDPDEAMAIRDHMRDRLNAARGQVMSGLGVGAQERLRAIDEQLHLLGDVVQIYAPSGELEAKASQLASRLSDLEYQQQRYTAWLDRQKQAREMQRQIDALRAIGKAVDQMIASVLDSQIGAFIGAASTVLSPDRLALELYDGGRQVCRLGIDTGGQVRSWRALSGAERARCLSAIAAAWAARSDAPVRLIVVDDVWLDARSLAALCDGLSRVVGKPGGPTQAIVAAVQLSAVPKGWHVVDCGSK